MIKSGLFLILLIWSQKTFSQTWDEYVYMGKEEHAKGNSEQSIAFLTKAAKLKGQENFELYLYAGILSAKIKQVDDSFELLEKAIKAGMWDIPRLKRNHRLDILHDNPRWQELFDKVNIEEQAYIKKAKLSHKQLRQQLKDMWKNDQDLVGKWTEQRKVVDKNTTSLKEIINKDGWPNISMVGKDCSWMAWAIVQHSHDIDFQRKCLKMMAMALESGDIDPTLYAELHDRISKNSNENQLYGMATITQNGKKTFYPIKDVQNIDIRRKKIGLPPLKVFANVNYIDYQSK